MVLNKRRYHTAQNDLHKSTKLCALPGMTRSSVFTSHKTPSADIRSS